MANIRPWITIFIGSWLAVSPHAQAAGQNAGPDDYAAMLGYLASSRIDGHAFQGASGASATNMAAGDLNLQANLRVVAVGDHASALIQAQQLHRDNHADAPLSASASIGGQAYVDGHGLASINQVSGNGNAELNAVAATLTMRGIRETTDGTLSAAVSASARGQSPDNPGVPGGTRHVAVESSAMKGFEGVLQLNQIAGSGNITGNQLLLTVPSTPR